MARRTERVDAGSGDVFVDLGFADASERGLRLRLAVLTNDLLAERRLTQREAAVLLGLAQPHVSELAHYKLRRFSSERLLHFLTLLSRDIEIRIHPTGRRARGRVSVSVARAHGPGT